MTARPDPIPNLVIGPVRRLPSGPFVCDAARLRGAGRRLRWSIEVWSLDPTPGGPIAWSGRAQAAAVRRRRIEEAAARGAVIAFARSGADVAALDGCPASAFSQTTAGGDDPFLIVVGDERCRIDEGRATERGLSTHSLDRIKALHRERLQVVQAMRGERDLASLRALAADHERLEFDLQDAWGYPRDRRFHRWWTVPGCRCPGPENEDAWGSGQRYVRSDCPIHGDPPDD